MSGGVRLILGDCLDVLPTLDAGSIDSCVTDPPYDYNFMSRKWDATGVAFRPETWAAVRRVLKPGGYLLAFGGTRTWHRQACAIEDAGFPIRDTVMWLYGQGFPKGKACLKPAWEPITLAWNPAPRVTPLNIDACRVPAPDGVPAFIKRQESSVNAYGDGVNGSNRTGAVDTQTGRYPSNLVMVHHPDCRPCGTKRVKGSHDREPPAPGGGRRENRENWRFAARTTNHTDPDGTEEVTAWECHESCVVAALDRQSGERKAAPRGPHRGPLGYMGAEGYDDPDGVRGYGDSGGASRFFPQFAWEADDFAPFLYCPKASKADRGVGNTHITVKPTALMAWLARLVTPTGGTVLDPFLGSGTTGVACVREGFSFVGIESDPEAYSIARRRVAAALAATPLFA